MKRKLFFLLSALLLGLSNISADVMIETDLTSQFNSLATTKWTLSSGQVGWAAPQVTTNSGLTVAAWERYEASCNWTGDIMYSTVTGLAAGTYKIELYGAAAFTFGRSFGSTAFTGDFSVDHNDAYHENDAITEETGVTLYAETSEGTVSEEIPIWYATNFNTSGIATATLNNVVVGSSGTIKIGLSKTSTSTNWHVVQLKGVTATVSGDAVVATLKATAEALLSDVICADAREALVTAISDTEDIPQTQVAYQAVIVELETAISKAEASAADYANLKAAIDNAYVPASAAGKAISAPAITAAQGVYDAAEVDDCSAAITALTDANKSAYEADYGAFANDYAYDYSTLLNTDLTKWTQSDYAVMTGGEHWNGLTGQRYYEQSGAEWSQSSWNHSASQTATLPAGHYIMSITARASGDVTSSMSVKIGDNEPVVVSLANKGASGRGIMTDGTGSFQDGTYANGGAGYGWEYRFIAFTLEEESSVTFSFNSATNASHNWVSIANPLLKGDVHPNQIELNQVHALATELTGYEEEISAATYATFADDLAAAAAATLESTNLDEIITSLEGDIAKAQAEKNDYATLKSAIEDYSAKAALLDADGQAAFDISEIVTAYNERTYTGEQAVEVVIIIRNTYVSAVKSQTSENANMTDAIINPSFETGDLTGWSVEASNDTGARSTSSGTYAMDGSEGNYLFNTWSAGNEISQSLDNMPAGVYRLTAVMATDADHTLQLKMLDQTAEATSTAKETGIELTVEAFLEGASSLNISAVTADNCWYKADNFRLTYVCSDATIVALRDEITGLVAAVEAITSMPESLATEAANAIAEANGILENNVFDLTVLNASKARLEAVIEAASDFTSYIVNAALTSTDPKGFDDAGTKGIDGSGIVKAGNNAQFDFKQTISLPAGQYKLTAQAAYRYSGSEADEYAAIQAGATTKFASLYAKVGTVTSSALVQNRWDGASDTDLAGSGATVVNEKYVPNSSSAVKAWFEAGKYVNEVTFNMTAAGDVTIGIEKTAQPEVGDYTVIGPWTLTRIGDPDLSDYYNQINTLLGQAAEITGAQSAATSLELKEAGEEGLALVEGASTDVVALQASIDRLTAAVSASQASAAAYAALQTALNSYAPKAAALDEAGQAAFDAAGIETGITEGTYSTEEATALAEDMPARFIAAVKAQTTIGSDWTELINNWDFLNCSNGNFPGWTIYAPNGGNTWKHGDTCVEYWIATTASGVFDYYQTITDLPAGKYSLSASMWNTDGTVDGQCGVYATSGSNTVFAGVTTDSGDADLHTYSTENIVVIDGTLRLGVKNATTMGARWFGVDWIKLTYQGTVDVDSYYEAIAALLTEAAGLVDGVMNADVETALNDAIAATANYTEVTDIPALQAMIDGLTAANAAAVASIANYQEAAAIVNAASTLDEYGQASYDSNESVLEVKSAFEARTLTAVSDEQKSACQTALKTAVKVQTTEGSDWTLLIDNPGFETGNTNGWTIVSSDDTGARSTSNATYAMEGAEGSWLFNTWWKGNPLTQNIGELPAGEYKLSAMTASDGATVYLIANGEHNEGLKCTNAAVASLNEYSFKLYSTSEVTIGVVGGNNDGTYNPDGYWWYKADVFKLTLVRAGLPELIKVVGKMNATVSLAQDNALEAYEENPSEANYLAAADAIAAAQASVDAYTEGKKALDRVDELLAKTNVYTDDAFMAFGEANLAAQKGYDDGTWTNEEAQSYGPTVFGRPNDWRGANTIQDLLLSAFDVHGGDYDHGYYINTWSTEGDNDGSGFTTPFIEYWTGDNDVLGDFTIHAQMTGLEAGVYTVTALVRQRLSNGYDVTTPVEGLGLGVCEWEVIPSSGEINVENTRFFIESIEAQGEVFADGVLDINFIVKSANCSWVSIKDVKFEKTGAPTGIKSVEEADVEGLKDGKYLIKGQIVIVRNGKQYNAAGSLQK